MAVSLSTPVCGPNSPVNPWNSPWGILPGCEPCAETYMMCLWCQEGHWIKLVLCCRKYVECTCWSFWKRNYSIWGRCSLAVTSTYCFLCRCSVLQHHGVLPVEQKTTTQNCRTTEVLLKSVFWWLTCVTVSFIPCLEKRCHYIFASNFAKY